MVGAGQQRFRTLDLIAGQHVRRWPVQLDAVAFGVNLIDPGCEPFGQPSRIGEHDGGSVRVDQIDDPGLDLRPDGVVLQVRHIGHWHLNRQFEGLGRRRVHDPSGPGGQERSDSGIGSAAGEEAGDFLGRSDSR